MTPVDKVAEILRRELRLVSAHTGEVCHCGSVVDETWRVKEGNIEMCAALIVAELCREPAPTAGQE